MGITNQISLAGQTAIITGAGRGLGLASAEALACAGANVALVDLNAALVHEAAGGLSRQGYTALPLPADVSQPAAAQAAVEQTLHAWGRVDILVNNAGVCPVTPFEEISEIEWDRVMAVNLKGTFLFCQAAAPVMRAQHRGRIINMSSSAGQTGGIIAGLHYSASKAGIIGLTRSLARYLAPDIQVNAIAPGMIDTDMTNVWPEEVKMNAIRQMPLRRLGTVEDVAWAVLFLASEASNFITGQTLSVSGGLYLS